MVRQEDTTEVPSNSHKNSITDIIQLLSLFKDALVVENMATD
jgi:hypothetical protein